VPSALVKKLYGFFLLSRPINVIIVVCSIFIAAVICGSLNPVLNIICAVTSGAFIMTGANAINDYFDIEIDKINKPRRPLPRGLVTKKETFWFSISCFAVGFIISMIINWAAIIVALCTILLLYLYSSKLKKTVLAGNFLVSFVTALAFVYGGVAVGRIREALIPAVFAFMVHLGREVIKDMEDMQGDKEHNAITLPVKYGLLPAQKSVTFIFVLLTFITLVPFLLKSYGLWYFIIVLFGVDTILIYTIAQIWLVPERKNFRRLSEVLKADMFVGLLAIYAGRW
jgi:geranylgeranylglycerol-phosphate geranylgeranyltransferase